MAASRDPDEDYFRAIPWCAKLIDDPNFMMSPSNSRLSKANTEDSLLAETLKTQSTIGAYVTLFKHSAPGLDRVDEIRVLISLGDSINGYAHVCHGGIVATILDETMGSLVWKNKDILSSGPVQATLTANLKISYLAPVVTPQVVLVTGHTREIKGRKCYVDGTVEDGSRKILARGEAMWIAVPKLKEKL